MNLLVDFGNRYLKWATIKESQWDGGYGAEISGPKIALFNRCWRHLSTPQQVIASNVLGKRIESTFTNWSKQNWGITPSFLETTKSLCGIINSYQEPSQLGSDRLAALIGARSLSSGTLGVIDCGTAVTVDVLSHEDIFLGGAILPGLRLAHKSLLKNTRGIMASDHKPGLVLGRSTAACVSSGVNYGLAGGIDRLVTEIEKAVKQRLKWYITGGDALHIQSFLTVQVTHEPELVLKGLAVALDQL